MNVNSTKYPKLHELLDIIVHDIGAGDEHSPSLGYRVNDQWRFFLGILEITLMAANLTEEETQTMAVGDESEMSELVKKHNLQEVNAFLNDFF